MSNFDDRYRSLNRRVGRGRPLTRRTFLRGVALGSAVGLALPPLEAMLTDRGAFADGTEEPPFFGVFFWANGLPWNDKHGAQQAGHPDLWTPSSTGPGYAPSELLMPLSAHSPTVVTGLTPKTQTPSSPGGQGDGHMRGFMVALTGDRPRSEGFHHESHTLTALRPSLDQYVARHPMFYSEAPRFRSLQVGVSEARFHPYGHWNGISYNGPDSINQAIMDPGRLFDVLFEVQDDQEALLRRAAVVDAVKEEADTLRSQLGLRDRDRLDAHIEHLNEIGKRLAFAGGACEVPTRPADRGDLIEKTRATAELLAIAVNCGLTRSFSFMLTSPATTHVFSNLSVRNGMHKICHDGDWEDVRNVTRYQMEAFSAFLDAFAAVPQAEGGTLLDRGLIYGTSEYGEGWKHSVKELPVVLAGTACGGLRSGVHARLPNGNMADAQLTALRALGLPQAEWGFNGAETSGGVSEIAG